MPIMIFSPVAIFGDQPLGNCPVIGGFLEKLPIMFEFLVLKYYFIKRGIRPQITNSGASIFRKDLILW